MINYTGPTNKVVLDTNVLVAAGFNPQSSSAQIISAIKAKELLLTWDQSTITETKMIIDKIPPLSWNDFTSLYNKPAEYKGKISLARFSNISDPDDRKFAALADATGATLISNDDHLLSVRDNTSISILTPSEFIKEHKSNV